MNKILNNIQNIFNNHFYAFSLYSRQIAGTLVILIIARYLSVYDYGLFSSYRSIAIFLLMFANLSFADYILVSSKANSHEVKLKISLFLVYSVTVAIFILICSYFYKFESYILFALVLVRTFFDSTFFALILPYFQSTKKFNTIAGINVTYSVGLMLIAMIAFIYKFSLVKFLLMNIIFGIINFIHCSRYAKLDYLLLFNNFKKIICKIDKKILDFIGITIGSYLYGQIAPLFIATIVSKTDAALFFAAFTIANIVKLLIVAQTQKMVPELINNSVENIRQIIRKNLKYILCVTSLLLIFMLFAGKIILKLVYGQDYYTNAYYVLLILLLSNIVYAESAIYGAYIVASNNVNKILYILFQTSIVSIIALFVLHKYGIYAAAISLLIATAFLAYRYTIFVLNLLKSKSISENL